MRVHKDIRQRKECKGNEGRKGKGKGRFAERERETERWDTRTKGNGRKGSKGM